MTEQKLIPGSIGIKANRAYIEEHAGDAAEGHYSDFLNTRLRLSSIGVGTFPGAADTETDARQAAIVSRALQSGINVIDTGAHYRYGRSLAAVGAGVRDAVQRGVPREAMFLMSKGGFLTFRGGKPDDMDAWFQREIEAQGLGTKEDLAGGAHLLTPEYINYQLELSRSLMGVETLDAFLIDQPEVHIPEIGKDETNKRLARVFVTLERAVREKRLRYYGLSTFYALRVETDAEQFQSITSMIAWAEKAAQEAEGSEKARHHFKIVTFPYNQVMLEAFTRFNTATGEGNVASPIQAAHQLGVYCMASHSLLKGNLAQASAETVEQALPDLSPVRRGIQFNRSTPGLGTTLVGLSTPEHLEDVLAVAKLEPLGKQAFLSMFKKAEDAG